MSKSPLAKDYIKSFPNDFIASVVVLLIAIPLCLGIALASGAPLFSGLIAGIIGGIVVGLASKSHLSVSGPAAGLTAIVAVAISTLPSFPAFLVVVVLCGCIQLFLGFLKAGFLGDYVPRSVIKGMLVAIGLILTLKQIPHLLGYDRDYEGDQTFLQPNNENTFSTIIHSFQQIIPGALVIGICCILFYISWEKFIKLKTGLIKTIPAPLLVIFLGIFLHATFKEYFPAFALQGNHLVMLPQAQTANDFFSFFSTPDWQYIWHGKIIITAVTLALVASLESLLSIEAIDELDPYKRVTPPNRELKAQGIGNIVSGLIGGLPVTSVIVRSSANIIAGAKTKMATIYQGLLLLLVIAFIPGFLNLIPKAALAAVLIMIGIKLAKVSQIKNLWLKGLDQFLPFIITIIAILLTDLLIGILIGIIAGLFFVIRSNFKTALLVINDGNNYLFRLRKDVSFLNKPIIKAQLEKVPANSFVLIDVSRADFIDRDVVDIIEDFMIHAPLKNIQTTLKTGEYKSHGFQIKK